MQRHWRCRVGRLALAALLGAAAPSAALADLSVEDLAEMERLLASLNFDPGTIDGVVDERTRTAIRLYQEFAALHADGEPTEALLAELRAVAEVFAEMKVARAAAAAAVRDAPPVREEVADAGEPEAAPPAPEEPLAAPPNNAAGAEAAPEALGSEVQEEDRAADDLGAPVADAGEPGAAPPAPEEPLAAPPNNAAGAEAAPEALGSEVQEEDRAVDDLGAPVADAGEPEAAPPQVTGEPETPADLAATEAAPEAPDSEEPRDDRTAVDSAIAEAPAGPAAEAADVAEDIEPAPSPGPDRATPVEPAAEAPDEARAGAEAAPPSAPETQVANSAEAGEAHNEREEMGSAPPAEDRPEAPEPEKTANAQASEPPVPAASTEVPPPTPPVPAKRPATPKSFDLNRMIARLVQQSEDRAADHGTAETPEAAPEPVGPNVARTPAATVVPPDLNGYEAFKEAFAAARDGDLDRAIAYYSGAIESGDLTLEHLAAALFNRANAYYYEGAFDEAIADYDAAVANKPEFPAAYYNRGFSYAAKGERARAVEDYKKAGELGLQRLGVRAPDLAPPFP